MQERLRRLACRWYLEINLTNRTFCAMLRFCYDVEINCELNNQAHVVSNRRCFPNNFKHLTMSRVQDFIRVSGNVSSQILIWETESITSVVCCHVGLLCDARDFPLCLGFVVMFELFCDVWVLVVTFKFLFSDMRASLRFRHCFLTFDKSSGRSIPLG